MTRWQCRWWPRRWGVVAVLAAGLTIAAGGAMPAAGAPAVVHRQFRIEGRFQSVEADGRYVVFGLSATRFRLRDEQTGRRVTIIAPCPAEHGAPPGFGGPYLLLSCHRQAALYALASGRWMTIPITPNADCAAAVAADCEVTATAVGSRWLAVSETWNCMEHGCASATDYLNLASGQRAAAGALDGVHVGGTIAVDLASPTLTRRLCPPLRVPSGRLIAAGRSTIAEALTASGASVLTIGRCGAHRQLRLGPIGGFTGNAGSVVWDPSGPGHSFAGLRLADWHRFTIPLPRALRALTGWNFVMSARRLYVQNSDTSGRVWSTPAPA